MSEDELQEQDDGFLDYLKELHSHFAKEASENSDCFVMIGGVPFRARTMETKGGAPCEFVILGERVGNRDIITKDVATTFFDVGSIMPVIRDGVHETTGKPLYRIAELEDRRMK
jgi:hypothetical protein